MDNDVPLKKNRPVAWPRKLIYLCGVEWAWSPAHTRMDGDAVVAVSTKKLDADSRKFDIARALSVFVTEKAIRQACV